MLENRARALQAREERLQHALSQIQDSPRKVDRTLRIHDWQGVRLPTGAQYSNNLDVTICAIFVAAVVTMLLRYVTGWNFSPNWQNLAITGSASLIAGAIYFNRHLVLARRLAVTLVLGVVVTLGLFFWSLHQSSR